MTRHPWVPDRWQHLDVTVRDLPLALVLALASFVPAVQGAHGTQVGGLPHRAFGAAAAGVVVLQCLPLVVRRRLPAVCLTLVTAGFVVDQLRAYHTVAGVALLVALASAGAHLSQRRRTTVIVLSAAYVALVLALVALGATDPVEEYVTLYLVLAAAWGGGSWLRTTRASEAGRRRRAADDARAAERTRLARELHDVVTHHVTAMVVQAEAARYLTAQPERLDETLDAVTGTGRRAITDLRQLLDVLDPGHDAQQRDGAQRTTTDADALQALVEQTRRAGQPVELVESGRPAPAGRARDTAYRVVQEALTNALKHAHGSPTSVDVRHDATAITVEVRTRGPAAPGGAVLASSAVARGGGRGLVGLDERVGMLGGTFAAGRQPGGDFLVQARIPAGGAS